MCNKLNISQIGYFMFYLDFANITNVCTFPLRPKKSLRFLVIGRCQNRVADSRSYIVFSVLFANKITPDNRIGI